MLGKLCLDCMEEKFKKLVEALAVVDNRHPVTLEGRMKTSVSDHTEDERVIKWIPLTAQIAN